MFDPSGRIVFCPDSAPSSTTHPLLLPQEDFSDGFEPTAIDSQTPESMDAGSGDIMPRSNPANPTLFGLPLRVDGLGHFNSGSLSDPNPTIPNSPPLMPPTFSPPNFGRTESEYSARSSMITRWEEASEPLQTLVRQRVAPEFGGQQYLSFFEELEPMLAESRFVSELFTIRQEILDRSREDFDSNSGEAPALDTNSLDPSSSEIPNAIQRLREASNSSAEQEAALEQRRERIQNEFLQSQGLNQEEIQSSMSRKESFSNYELTIRESQLQQVREEIAAIDETIESNSVRLAQLESVPSDLAEASSALQDLTDARPYDVRRLEDMRRVREYVPGESGLSPLAAVPFPKLNQSKSEYEEARTRLLSANTESERATALEDMSLIETELGLESQPSQMYAVYLAQKEAVLTAATEPVDGEMIPIADQTHEMLGDTLSRAMGMEEQAFNNARERRVLEIQNDPEFNNLFDAAIAYEEHIGAAEVALDTTQNEFQEGMNLAEENQSLLSERASLSQRQSNLTDRSNVLSDQIQSIQDEQNRMEEAQAQLEAAQQAEVEARQALNEEFNTYRRRGQEVAQRLEGAMDYTRKAPDNTDGCAHSKFIGEGVGQDFSCDGTQDDIDSAQLYDMLLGAVGEIGTTATGQIEQASALSEGTQSAAFKGAETTAKVAAIASLTKGIMNIMQRQAMGELEDYHADNGANLTAQTQIGNTIEAIDENDALAAGLSGNGFEDTRLQDGTNPLAMGTGYVAAQDQNAIADSVINQYDLNSRMYRFQTHVDENDPNAVQALATRRAEYDIKRNLIEEEIQRIGKKAAVEQAEFEKLAKKAAFDRFVNGAVGLVQAATQFIAAKQLGDVADKLEQAEKPVGELNFEQDDLPPNTGTTPPAGSNLNPPVNGAPAISEFGAPADDDGGFPDLGTGFDVGGPEGPVDPNGIDISGKTANSGGNAGSGNAGIGTGNTPLTASSGPAPETQPVDQSANAAKYGGGGGRPGSYSGGRARGNPRPGGSAANRPDLSALAKMFGDQQGKKKQGILDLNSSQNRGPASQGSLLGKNVNLFNRISRAYQYKKRQGVI